MLFSHSYFVQFLSEKLVRTHIFAIVKKTTHAHDLMQKFLLLLAVLL